MTSSLVGSEMCIRDRDCGACTGVGVMYSRYSQAVSNGVNELGPTSGSVSYTHLTLPTICSV
eukprot:161584-Prorocentrum_lima.AAC.1